MDTIRKVTATQVVRDLRGVRDMLDNGAVAVTSHGRTEMIVISESDFSRLQLLSGTDADRLNSKLQMVMDTIDSLILILDNDMRIRRANRAYREYFGLEGVDLVGESILDRNRTATDRFITHKAEGVLASGIAEQFDMPSAHRPDRQFSYIIKPWPLGVAIFATDVTERVELTRRKLRNEAIEMTLQHVSGVGVGVINRGGVIEFANAGFGNMMGSRDGDLAGQSFLSFLSPDCRSTVRDYLEHGQEEPVAIPVSYLRNGTDMASAMLSLQQYYRGDVDQFAFTMHDPQLGLRDMERLNPVEGIERQDA